MDNVDDRQVGTYLVRQAGPGDIAGARSVMLDSFYHVFGHGYVPRWHADVIDLAGTYLDHPRHGLFVATRDDEVVGTAAVRAEGPATPPHPPWLAERYPSGRTAQLYRVYIRPDHRRRGLAGALVQLACSFAGTVPGYDAIYLHTNAEIEGAEPFWRSVADLVHDGRTDARFSPAVHFEIPLPGSGQDITSTASPR